MDLSAWFEHLLEGSVLVVRVVVAGIEMAADALKVQLLLVVVIVQMGSDAVVCDAFRIEVYVAFLA